MYTFIFWIVLCTKLVKGVAEMFDWFTCILCIFFLVPSTLYAYKVCQFELKYLESFGDKESFYPRYAYRHPFIAFGLIALLNFASVFFVYGVTTFLVYMSVQIIICVMAFATIQIKKLSPKAFDFLSVVISFLCFLILVIASLR